MLKSVPLCIIGFTLNQTCNCSPEPVSLLATCLVGIRKGNGRDEVEDKTSPLRDCGTQSDEERKEDFSLSSALNFSSLSPF